MTLSETSDWPEIAISETAAAGADDFDFAVPAIAVDDSAARDDAHPEPSLAATPFFIEFDEPMQLDPERAGLVWELPPMVSRAIDLRSPVAALLFHLLPLIAIVIWPLMMVEPPPPIPVQLVFEAPPPPPPPPQQPQQPQPKRPQPKFEVPPHGPLSSVDQGVVKPATLGRTPDPVPMPSAGPQQQTTSDAQTATAAQSPPMPPPKPVPPKENQSAFQLKPSGAQTPHHEETPHEASHSARYAGPAATRDEYLAYLVSLTRQHMNLLPMSAIGDRRGETVISVVVYDNGGIGPLGIIRSSGYTDIDERIEQMVKAVGKFPPLPQWFQGNAVQLELTLRFPEALEHQ
ncbi:MAG TPA: TonB C-terminal domain-containing protein [Stellaceae bacterium]|nr:TonB C-terminal domain-containing protein [Stellaceae bacterium]